MPHKAFVTIKGEHFAVFMNPSEFVRNSVRCSPLRPGKQCRDGLEAWFQQ